MCERTGRQHDEVPDSGDRVNAAVVWLQVTSLAEDIAAHGHLCGNKLQRAMAVIPYAGNAVGDDQQVAQGSRTSICQRAVGAHSLPGYGPVISVNRPVRLPAAGRDPHARWCGDWGRKAPGYPIGLFFDFLCSGCLHRIKPSS